MRSREALARLNNFELVLRLLSRLWRWMDAGGISQKRHVRAWLLEDALDLLRSTRTNEERLEIADEEVTEPLPGDLLDEALSRPMECPRLVFGTRVSIKFISNFYLAILLLLELRRWYEEDREKHPLDPLQWEEKIVEGCLRVVGLPKRNPKFPREVLIYEADERIREELRRTMPAW